MKVTKVIRKKHPRVRSVEDNGSLTYVVDCRAMSFYHGRKIQQFTSKEDCLRRVAEIEQVISSPDLYTLPARVDQWNKLLLPFSKTVDDAVKYYADHLLQKQQDEASALIHPLLDQWLDFKTIGNFRTLRPDSIRNIENYVKRFKEDLKDVPVSNISKQLVQSILDSKSIHQSQMVCKNWLRYLKSFLNYCVDQDHLQRNPIDSCDRH